MTKIAVFTVLFMLAYKKKGLKEGSAT